MSGKSVLKNYSGFINILSRIIDPVLIIVAAVTAYHLRFRGISNDLSSDYRILVLFSVVCVISVFPIFGLYSSRRGQSLANQASSITFAWLSVVLLMVIILFGLKISAEYSRLWLGYWAGLGLAFMLISRLCIYAFLQFQRKRGRNIRSVIIIGAGDLGKRVIEQIQNSPWTGYRIEGLFDDAEKLRGSWIGGCKVLGGVSDVEPYLARRSVDEVWLALPLRAEKRMKELLYDIRHYTVNIKLIPDIFGFSLLYHSMTEIAGLPVVNLSDSPMGGINRLVKEFEDKILAILILILILPLVLVISIAIKTTSAGPVLFKQRRHGWDGRVINVYKFRTMGVHKEEGGVITQAKKNDARVTKLGAFLRRTSLDELPQFYNVLQGRMSIVGPRPHAIEHNELYKDKVDKYMLRHMVKPGITGWAQVNGYRGETDTLEKMKKRIEFDLYYIENWSLWFDLKIIFMTIIKGFIHKNAY